jgi:hypothetical protein
MSPYFPITRTKAPEAHVVIAGPAPKPTGEVAEAGAKPDRERDEAI